MRLHDQTEHPPRREQTFAQLMRLSREKTVRLSHVITDVLVAVEDVEFIEDRATIRQNVVDILIGLLKEEEQIDAQVRQKIGSQKKEILEGSEEWEVLYRKYYAEEMRRYGHRASAEHGQRHGSSSAAKTVFA